MEKRKVIEINYRPTITIGGKSDEEGIADLRCWLSENAEILTKLFAVWSEAADSDDAATINYQPRITIDFEA